jgi:molecular chaperone GrpE
MAEKNNKNNKNDKPLLEEMVNIPKKEFEALKAKSDECDSYYDKYVRAHAEFENAKKRMEKDKADYARFANESFIIDLLPIIDSLDISEKHIKEAKDFKAVQEGVDMIHVQIQKFLKDIGVEKVKTVGEKFDPHQHEAIEITEANDKEEGLITEELKPGYSFNGRLLRPASVKIVKHKDQ